MKRFLVKIAGLAFAFGLLNLLLLIVVPTDESNYLYEYNHKVQLLDTVSQPRIIFLGGSSTAFNNDSRTIQDSTGYNIINCGLHAGLGIKIPLKDGLQYIKEGDIVVMQIEYANFFNGGNGEPETLPSFMVTTNWRYCRLLNLTQWKKLIQGIPRENVRSLMNLAKTLANKNGGNLHESKEYVYVKEGFNEFGDEVNHLNFPGQKYTPTGKTNTKKVNPDFIKWLSTYITYYEKAGAKIVMLPPSCIASYLPESYNENIGNTLAEIQHPYLVHPSLMTVNDSCMFNTEYHLTKEGVRQNTQNIIKVLKENNIIQAPNSPK